MLKRPQFGLDGREIDEKAAAFEAYCRKGAQGLEDFEKKALTVSNDTTGGYLAPPAVSYTHLTLPTICSV